MPRTYRRQSSKAIVRAPKKSWNIGLVTFRFDILTFNQSNSLAQNIIINNNDSSVPTATVIQAKNIKIYGTITLQNAAVEAGTAHPVVVMSYIVYIPQLVYDQLNGFSQDGASFNSYCSKIIHDHPEWIMSTKNVNVKYTGGTPGEQDVTKFTQTSGVMKRNLRSGDRIMHIVMFQNTDDNSTYHRSALFNYTFNTCDN